MRKITKIRIRNSALIVAIFVSVGIGLYIGFESDGRNRFWEGKALGGSIAIIGITLYLLGITILKTYKRCKSIGEVGSTLKKGFLDIISTDFRNVNQKKKKR